jgi:hypothetical protein
MIAYYFLPAIVFLGIITSYEDFKLGKIRNKWVLGAIAFAFFIYLLLFLNGQISGKEIYLTAINFLMAIAFSFVLWNFRFWSAGDGKLFICYCALIPAGLYSAPFVNFFPSFNLFVNTIVLFFAYLTARNILVIPRRKVGKAFYESLKKFPETLVSILSVSWIARLVGGNLNLGSMIYSFVLYAGVYAAVNLLVTKTLSHFKINKIKPIHMYLALIVLRVFFDSKSMLDLNFIISIIASAVLYSFLMRTVYNMLSENVVKTTPILELKAGDILCNKEGKKGRGFSTPQPEGLTAEEIKKIRAFCKKKKIKTVPVAETTTFAPAMLAGVIITLVFGNIANLIYLLGYAFKMLWWLF